MIVIIILAIYANFTFDESINYFVFKLVIFLFHL